jgi:hypothetical protein
MRLACTSSPHLGVGLASGLRSQRRPEAIYSVSISQLLDTLLCLNVRSENAMPLPIHTAGQRSDERFAPGSLQIIGLPFHFVTQCYRRSSRHAHLDCVECGVGRWGYLVTFSGHDSAYLTGVVASATSPVTDTHATILLYTKSAYLSIGEAPAGGPGLLERESEPASGESDGCDAAALGLHLHAALYGALGPRRDRGPLIGGHGWHRHAGPRCTLELHHE